MNPQSRTATATADNPIASTRKPWYFFGILSALLTSAFFLPLWDLAQYGLNNDLYSHCWLMPVVVIYLVWMDRDRISYANPDPLRGYSIIPLFLAVASFCIFWINREHWTGERYENYLSSVTFSFVMTVYAAAFLTLGKSTIRSIAFPLFLALFMVPFPVFVKEGIETFFQHTSADAAFWMIKLAGINIFREGLVFHLSSIVMEVAPQCSGIRSSLVLFITSLVASHLFLKTGWKRLAIVLFVVPLAILRNGFRISTLAYLCENISPDMIDSWVHHRGGPLFFALSLIPFFILLYVLWRTEPRNPAREST